MSPDARSLHAFFRRASRRVRSIALLRALAIAFAAATVLVLLRVWPATTTSGAVAMTVGFSVLAVIVAWGRQRHSDAESVALVERQTPAAKNILITVREVMDHRVGIKPYVRERVTRDAAQVAADIDLRRTLPAARPLAMALASLAVLTAAVVLVPGRTAAVGIATPPSTEDAAVVLGVAIEMVPPGYAGLSARTFDSPARIDALAGSRLRIAVAADAANVALETLSGRTTFEPRGGRRFELLVPVETDGYLAIEPIAANGRAGVRKLIGLSVLPDHSPQVKITAPGRDLLLPDGSGAVNLVVEAADDLGLAALAARYTKVTGSGENFTFTTGEIPMAVTRTADRAWNGRGTIQLPPLALEPGDMVIYRALAADRRPGATPAESETFIIEIAAAGALPSDGFAIDDRQDRYAISQQMVIVKTERLLARRGQLTRDEFADEAAGLAAEQRQVRAEFVFMMGGELADEGLNQASLNEEAEADLEDDLSAGRLVNQGRADLVRAIRAMSRAAARLADANVAEALSLEKQALTSLQRAFARTRYILRTLSERERIDLSRRLSGLLGDLSRDRRAATLAETPARLGALRRALADVATLTTAPVDRQESSSAASAIARRILAIDPASDDIRKVAQLVNDAAGFAEGADPTKMRAPLQDAAVALAALARSELLASRLRFRTGTAAALDGALADELLRAARPGAR